VSIQDTQDWANKSAPTGSSQYIIDTEFDGPNATVTMVGGVSEQAHPTVTAFDVDVSGRLVPIYPDSTSGLVSVGTSSTPVITGTPARLFSMDVISNAGSAQSGHIQANGDVIAAWASDHCETITIDLQLYFTIFDLVAIASDTSFSVVVRYAVL
jgi:hypothetical protein